MKRLKEEEKEKGDCRVPPESFFLFFFYILWDLYLITSQMRVKRTTRISLHHRTVLHDPLVYPASAFDSRLRGG